MTVGQIFPLDAVRTDGWFERIGEGIGSFQALCEIVGERFFAFSMITGARITAVTAARSISVEWPTRKARRSPAMTRRS